MIPKTRLGASSDKLSVGRAIGWVALLCRSGSFVCAETTRINAEASIAVRQRRNAMAFGCRLGACGFGPPQIRSGRVLNALYELNKGAANLIRRVFLYVVNALNRDLALVGPYPAKVKSASRYKRARFGRDEELRNVALRQPCSIRLHDACHILRFARNGQLARPNQRGKPCLFRLERRPINVHIFVAESTITLLGRMVSMKKFSHSTMCSPLGERSARNISSRPGGKSDHSRG